MIGSLTSPSLVAGTGSVLAAAGLCAPYPGLFITDDASELAGSNGVLAAASPAPCGPQPDLTGIVHWTMADRGVIVDGSNRVSEWIDQVPHPQFNLFPVDSGNLTSPVVNHPVLVPGAIGGLPALDWGTWNATPTGVRWLQEVTSAPFASNVPRTTLVVCKPNSPVGGTLVTYGLTAPDRAWMVFNGGGGRQQLAGDDNGSNEWALGPDAGHPVIIDFTGRAVIFAWACDNAGRGVFYINGVAQAIFFVGSLAPEGVNGFSIGWQNASLFLSPAFSGLIGEVMGLNGNDPALVLKNTAYLAAKWKIT